MSIGCWRKAALLLSLLPLLMACGIMDEVTRPIETAVPADGPTADTMSVPTPLTTPRNVPPTVTNPPATADEPAAEPSEAAPTVVEKPTSDGATPEQLEQPGGILHDLAIESDDILILPVPAG